MESPASPFIPKFPHDTALDDSSLRTSIKYLSQELSTLGLSPLSRGFGECGPLDVFPLLTAAWELHGRLSGANKRIQEQSETIETLQADSTHYKTLYRRLCSEQALREKESGDAKDAMRQAQKQMEKCLAELKKEREQQKHLRTLWNQKESQFQHETRKLENEITKVQRCLRGYFNTRSPAKPTMTLSATLPRGDARRPTWKTETQAVKREEELRRYTIGKMEARLESLTKENIILRQCLHEIYARVSRAAPEVPPLQEGDFYKPLSLMGGEQNLIFTRCATILDHMGIPPAPPDCQHPTLINNSPVKHVGRTILTREMGSQTTISVSADPPGTIETTPPPTIEIPEFSSVDPQRPFTNVDFPTTTAIVGESGPTERGCVGKIHYPVFSLSYGEKDTMHRLPSPGSDGDDPGSPRDSMLQNFLDDGDEDIARSPGSPVDLGFRYASEETVFSPDNNAEDEFPTSVSSMAPCDLEVNTSAKGTNASSSSRSVRVTVSVRESGACAISSEEAEENLNEGRPDMEE